MPTVEDVYEKFGFVSEAAQLLEFELGTILFRNHAEEKGLFENQRPDLALKLLEKINRQTLGQLIRNAKIKGDSLDEIEALLSEALRERNRLAHSFYWEHNFRLRAEDDSGREIMLEDLERMHEIILEAYKALMLITGIDLDDVNEEDSSEEKLPDHVNLL